MNCSTATSRTRPGDLQLTVLARPTTNQVHSAPPSAWLRVVGDHESNSTFILDCIGCHQVPAPQFRDYANAMADVPGDARADITRRGWTAMVSYMNYVSAEEFGRGPERGTTGREERLFRG